MTPSITLGELRHFYTPENIQRALAPAVLFGVLLVSFVGGVALYFSRTWPLYRMFYGKSRERWAARKLQPAWPTRKQVALEIRWSVSSCAVYAVMTTALFYAAVKGWTRIYLNFSDYGWPWFLASMLVMLVLHDAYFYATHRLSHQWRWFFRKAHRVHHQTTNPTPFADIMFHPLDAVVHAGFVPLFLFCLPLHPIAFALFMTLVTAVNAIGHVGFELFPERWRGHWFWRHVSRAESHNLHHSRVQCNYGLYFTFWDRLLRTDAQG
jgi:sterol desaturase/sphingolipid hydroxylase (fatty acid hydroxylase superfamily)